MDRISTQGMNFIFIVDSIRSMNNVRDIRILSLKINRQSSLMRKSRARQIATFTKGNCHCFLVD